MTTLFNDIWALVSQVPCGRVVTYGQIAALLRVPGGARTVGWAMHALPEGSDVPWHRVVGAGGAVRLPDHGGRALQIMLLRQEGVAVDDHGGIDLVIYQWQLD